MKRFLLPLLLILLGAGGGIGAGLFLRPPPAPAAEGEEAHAEVKEEPLPPEEQPEYVKMSNQFIIPLLTDGKIDSIIVMALSLEAKPGSADAIYAVEPKLRDTFLQILFDHANSGGFRGSFTESTALTRLREQLLEAAEKIMPEVITDVLITDIGRQDS
ncbi:MAG: flagellar basal body-associated FliL family protein [Gemmobacter sp.]|uniref:flagellar basal body-associated FliL family protein n=1 Tax=Gemmobacter sp. TaxID=1898957 RepID=UPI001A619375|nr:flagellar basal body-associated FliL family protein [Gemmobacter sp.]MBL8561434.1 flagellar basal body-associated FliL family protein [Gemmobacter sp.]